MNKTIMLLASAVAAVAFAALPAMASAGEPQTHCDKGGATCPFTVSGGAVALSTTSGLTTKCTGLTGTGTMGTTTGTISLTFTGCREQVFNTLCNSTGQAAGTIVTTPLTYHNVYSTEDNKNETSALFTGVEEHFLTYTCLTMAKKFSGNGVIGELESPDCGQTSTKAIFEFRTTGSDGAQRIKKITNTGTEYDLNSNGTTAALETTATATLNGGETFTLTCV